MPGSVIEKINCIYEGALLEELNGKPVKTLTRDGFSFHRTPLQMAPEKRIYLASQQPQTMVAIHSVPEWDLYVVYEGLNPDTGRPIIKAFLNPLVSWLWAGVALIVFGTIIALVPSLTPATASLRVPATRAAPAEPALHGGR